MSGVTEFTQPVSYQSYFCKGAFETLKTKAADGSDILSLEMRYELQIESSRQYQTVFFYSQFLDVAAAEHEEEMWESHSCSVSNEADAFAASGPTIGKSLFYFNYYGSKLFVDEDGLFNKVNLAERTTHGQ